MTNLMAIKISFCFLILGYSSLILGNRGSNPTSSTKYTTTTRYTATSTRNATTTTTTTATKTTINTITTTRLTTTTKPYTATTTTSKPYSITTTKPLTTTTTTTKSASTTTTTTKPYTTTTATKNPAAQANAGFVQTQTTTTAPLLPIRANVAATSTSSTTTYATSASATPSVSSQSALTQNSFDIQQMACLVNYQRKLKGASPLTISSGINKIALGQSMFQAQTQTMTHSGVNNSTLIDRFDAANYPSQYVAENVAWNQRTAADVVQAWVNSPGHYANMINPLYTEFGCTAVNWYWTFDFGSSTGQGNTVPNCSGYQIP